MCIEDIAKSTSNLGSQLEKKIGSDDINTEMRENENERIFFTFVLGSRHRIICVISVKIELTLD